jgi:hypothetical protein
MGIICQDEELKVKPKERIVISGYSGRQRKIGCKAETTIS